MKRWSNSSLALASHLESSGAWDHGPRNYAWRLGRYLISSIDANVTLSPAEEKALTPWGACPLPPKPAFRVAEKLDSYWARWNWIKAAKEALNTQKALHWTRAADLISANPGKLVLKKPRDPGQGVPRPNTEHIANGLRYTAKKVLKDHQILYNYNRSCGGDDGLILVPYDRYLWLLLKHLTRRDAVDNELNANISNFKKTSLHAEKSATDEAVMISSEYPDDIAASLKVVMAGLFHVYTGSPLRIVPRIDWTPNLTSGGFNLVQRPRFIINDTKSAGVHVCSVKRKAPHDVQELDWLEAFLKVVTWMENNPEGLEANEKRDI